VKHATKYRLLLVALLLLAAWLRFRALRDIPPGLEMDELIANQIAEQISAGDWRVFYPAGQGRESLYFYWLAGWLTLLGKHVFALRVASSTAGLLGLACVYVLVRRLFNPMVALISLAFGATSFWTLFAARSGLRSVAMVPLTALSGYLFWRGLDCGSQKLRRCSRLFYTTGGFCLGMTFYAFTAARVLPAVFILFAVYLFLFHRPSLFGQWQGWLLGSLSALLVMLPLLFYLYNHPQADELGFRDFDRPLVALKSGDLQPVLQNSLETLKVFAFQGDPLIFDNVPGRPIFEPLSAFLFLLGIGIALVRLRQPAYAFALIWLLVALIPGMLSQPAPNFYRIVGAQAVTFAFPALAIVQSGRYLRRRWGRPPWQRRISLVLIGGLALILGVHLAGTWQAYFVAWPKVEGVSVFWQSGLAQAARYLDSSPEASPVALCTILTYEHDPWWRPAWQSMPYLLRRSDLDIRYYDCRTTLVLPTGTSVRYLFPDPSAPMKLIPEALRRGLFEHTRADLEGMPSTQAVLLHLDDPPEAFGPESGEAWWPPEAGDGIAVLPAVFGDSLALRGYQWQPARPRRGEALQLVTAWEVLRTPPPRLVMFTHLLTDPQTLVAQQDSLSLTSHSLRPGDRFVALHDQVWIPADIPSDELLVSIGLYSSDTLVRLSLSDQDQQRGDRLFLESVNIVP
jgi:hypothetical protein